MSNHTIYVPDDEWQKWRAEAGRLSGVLGRPLPLSEFVRISVAVAMRGESDGLGGESASRVMPGVNEQPREGKVGGLESRAPKAAPFRRPVTKADQTRRKKP